LNVDTFIRQIQDIQQRLAQIRGRTNEAPTQQQIPPKATNFQAASVDNPGQTLTLTQQQLEIMVAAFQELNATLEELQTTNEELSSSNLELQQANERFHLATNAINCIIFDWDIKNCLVHRTQGLVNVLGYRPEEAEPSLGWWTSRIHPDDRQRVNQEISQALAGSRDFSTEYRILNKDNQYLYVWDRGKILRDAAGQAVRVVGNTLNITPRKQAQIAQSESEERLSAIAANIPGSVYRAVQHPDGRMSLPYISAGVQKLTGLAPDDLIEAPERLFATIHPDDRSHCDQVMKLGYETLQSVQHEFRLITTSGEVKWIQDSACYFQRENGDVVADGVTLDITERKHSELLLRESEQRLLTILDSSPTNVYLKDLQGKYLLFNQECEKTLRLKREQVIGKTDYEFLPEAIAQPLVTNDQEVLRTLTPLTREEILPGGDGIQTFISVKFPLLDTAGVPYAICGMSTDISDRKKAEQALQQLNQELEERVKERTESLEQRNQQLLSKIAEHQQTLEALGQSKQRFSQLVANVPGIIYQFLRQTDGSMSFPYISSGCREIFELEPELIQDDAMALIKLIHPDDSVSFEESVVTSITTLQPWKWEGRFLTASGKVIWLSGASRPQQQANGDILWDGLLMDITERKHIEAALRQSEERFHQITENINQVFWIITPDLSQTLYVSPAYEKIWGKSCASLYENPRDWTASVYPEDREYLRNSLSRQLREAYDIQYRIVQPNGAIRWVRDRGFPVWDETGKIQRLVGFAEDITERKQVDEALSISEERFRTAVETMLDCFGIYTSIRDESGQIQDFRTEYLNPAACESDRVVMEEVIGKRLCELLPNHRESGLFDEYATVVETGNPLIKEDLIYEDTYGEAKLSRAYDVRIAKLGDGFAAVWRDITERKQADDALRESEQRFRQLAENINQVFWMGSLQPLKIVYVSPAYEVIWERTCESLYQNPTSWLDAVHPQDYDYVFAAVQKQAEGNYDIEYRIIRSDGSIRWIRDRVTSIRDEQGLVYRLAGIAEDITEQKQRAVEINNALQKERELSELKSSFVAMTSHEFRTPLATIQSSAELLERYQQKLSADKQVIHLKRIQMGVERMTQMLNDILIISEVEAGKLEFNPQPLNLVKFCRDLVEDLQLSAKKQQLIIFTHQGDCQEQDAASPESKDLDNVQHEKAEGRGQTAEGIYPNAFFTSIGATDCSQGVQCPSEQNIKPSASLPLPSREYRLDEKLLRQILSNLLSNALKYSPADSTVQFNLSFLHNKAIFRIEDQGIGIPQEDLSRLFESFHRATNVGTIQGTGLGLAIVKQCVNLHGGEITVESEVNQGTTFTVRLPLNH
jgi:PAS domain S-box-containing protein